MRQYEQRQKTKWIRVKKNSKCPICEKPDYCSVSEDGCVVRCMRIPSDKPSEGKDGFVSLEVAPDLAYEVDATIAEARRLHAAVDRPNLMIKCLPPWRGLPLCAN